MDKNLEMNLDILINMLDRKLEYMNEIYNIAVNQKTMIQSNEECLDLLRETGAMVKEKTLKVNALDGEFQAKYDEIGASLADSKADYKGYISILKDKIKECTELKLKIKLQEDKNKELLEK